MADAVINPVPVEGEGQFAEETLSERFMDWVRTELVWYAGSFTVHLLGLSLLLLVGFSTHENMGDAPVFESKAPDEPEKKEPEKFDKKFDIGEPPEEQSSQLDVDPTLEKPKVDAQDAKNYDDNPVFQERGGGTKAGSADAVGGGAGVISFGGGPKVSGALGIGSGVGTGNNPGKGADGTGFGFRGQGRRQAQLAQNGGTKHTEPRRDRGLDLAGQPPKLLRRWKLEPGKLHGQLQAGR